MKRHVHTGSVKSKKLQGRKIKIGWSERANKY